MRTGLVGGVLGALVGVKGGMVVIKKTGRPSFIVFILAFILFGSVRDHTEIGPRSAPRSPAARSRAHVALAPQGLLMLGTGAVQLQHTGFTSFRPLCGRAGSAAKLD